MWSYLLLVNYLCTTTLSIFSSHWTLWAKYVSNILIFCQCWQVGINYLIILSILHAPTWLESSRYSILLNILQDMCKSVFNRQTWWYEIMGTTLLSFRLALGMNVLCRLATICLSPHLSQTADLRTSTPLIAEMLLLLNDESKPTGQAHVGFHSQMKLFLSSESHFKASLATL